MMMKSMILAAVLFCTALAAPPFMGGKASKVGMGGMNPMSGGMNPMSGMGGMDSMGSMGGMDPRDFFKQENWEEKAKEYAAKMQQQMKDAVETGQAAQAYPEDAQEQMALYQKEFDDLMKDGAPQDKIMEVFEKMQSFAPQS